MVVSTIGRSAVCEEVAVELVVNGKTLVTFMCTPKSLGELATGYLYSSGLITGLEDILSNGACEDMKKIFVSKKGVLPIEQYSLAGVLSSACGSGSIIKEKLKQYQRVNSKLIITQGKLQALSKNMFAAAVLYKETGGVHCAGLANEKELIIWREDIGRHNAVDKVIGKALFMDLDLSQHFIITTGRLSSDMVLKAVTSRVPLIASRSIPSTLALEIAEQQGITLVGRVSSTHPVVYTHPWRVVAEGQAEAISF